MTLKDDFNKDMHDGENIPDMIRYNGYYISDDENSDGTINVLFDNGNLYTLKDNEVIDKKDGNHVDFIDKQIERFLNNYINGHPLLSKRHKYIVNSDDLISVDGDLILKLNIDRGNKIISIPNIMVVSSKHHGYGKEVIAGIYEIATKHSYKVYLVEMVESFYNKMIKRGAKIIYKLDAVEITPETKLINVIDFDTIEKQWEDRNLE